jgi:hypothetical protein
MHFIPAWRGKILMSSRRFWPSAVALLAAAFLAGSTLDATSEPSNEAVAITELQGSVDAIASDFGKLRAELLAANLATDPAVRAAAIAKVDGTLSRLSDECRQAERIYSQLQGSLPAKVGSASANASADLAEIVSDLSAAEQNLSDTQTLVASLQ